MHYLKLKKKDRQVVEVLGQTKIEKINYKKLANFDVQIKLFCNLTYGYV